MASASFWESVEYWAMGAVTLGVIGEYVAEFTKVAASEYWHPRINKWSTLLLIVALTVELSATVKTNNINNRSIADLANQAQQAATLAGKLGVTVDTLHDFVLQKETEADKQFTAFRKYVADAKAKNASVIADLNANRSALEKARRDALAAVTTAKKALVDMDVLLSQERAVRQQMVIAMTPRALLPVQQASFIEHLKPFHGTNVNVWRFQTTSTDSAPLSITLMKLLAAAQWNARGVSISLSGGYAKGIVVLKRGDASPATATAVSTLLQEFKADNIMAGVGPDFTGDGSQLFGSGSNVFEGVTDMIIVVGDK